MSFAILPAHDAPLGKQAAIANRAFAGYVAGWAEMDAAALARFLWLQGADLFSSRFVSVAGEPLGLRYINRTGNIPRLAAMALAPAGRGTGAAGHLLQHLCEEAKRRGEPAMILEVIEQNPRAHAFYQREGFRELGRLCGWRRPAGTHAAPRSSEVTEVPILEALRISTAQDYPALPWPISRHGAAKLVGARAFHRAGTAVVFANPDETAPIRVHSFYSTTDDEREIQNVLAGAMRLFPEREFFTPAVFPEGYGSTIFEPLGFQRETLSQFLMRRDF
ncbi:MAG: GNAT family N-acetyltransferase [Chthoniobacterales bacterium]